MIGVLTRPVDTWIDRPGLDWIGVAVCALMSGLVDADRLPGAIDHGAFYQTAAALSAALLSIGTLAITVVLTVTPNERLARVLDVAGPRLQRLIMNSLSTIVIVTAGFTSLFVLEAEASESVLNAAIVGLAVLLVARFARVWWLLVRILEVLMLRPEPEPEAGESWKKPAVSAGDYSLPVRRPTSSPPGVGPY